MQTLDISTADGTPIVAMHQNARFFKDEKTSIDMVEISFVGSKDTNIFKVKPKHMAQFREEWAAYCDGRPPNHRDGTRLTDIPGVDVTRAEFFIKANLHNAEELAALSDGQCQSVGHGVLTHRRDAQQLLAGLAARSAQKNLDRITEVMKAVPTTPAEPSPDIAAMKAEISSLKDGQAELKHGITAILAALADKPKRGRPPKPQE